MPKPSLGTATTAPCTHAPAPGASILEAGEAAVSGYTYNDREERIELLSGLALDTRMPDGTTERVVILTSWGDTSCDDIDDAFAYWDRIEAEGGAYVALWPEMDGLDDGTIWADIQYGSFDGEDWWVEGLVADATTSIFDLTATPSLGEAVGGALSIGATDWHVGATAEVSFDIPFCGVGEVY